MYIKKVRVKQKYYIVFQLTEFYHVTVDGRKTCHASFYRQKNIYDASDPYVNILVLVSPSNTIHEVVII